VFLAGRPSLASHRTQLTGQFRPQAKKKKATRKCFEAAAATAAVAAQNFTQIRTVSFALSLFLLAVARISGRIGGPAANAGGAPVQVCSQWGALTRLCVARPDRAKSCRRRRPRPALRRPQLPFAPAARPPPLLFFLHRIRVHSPPPLRRPRPVPAAGHLWDYKECKEWWTQMRSVFFARVYFRKLGVQLWRVLARFRWRLFVVLVTAGRWRCCRCCRWRPLAAGLDTTCAMMLHKEHDLREGAAQVTRGRAVVRD
jgi:hypothetical protein